MSINLHLGRSGALTPAQGREWLQIPFTGVRNVLAAAVAQANTFSFGELVSAGSPWVRASMDDRGRTASGLVVKALPNKFWVASISGMPIEWVSHGLGDPTCDATNHGKAIWITDPQSSADCTVGLGNAAPHPCTCVWDSGAGAGAWTAGGLGSHEASRTLEMRDHRIDFDGPEVRVIHIGVTAGVMTVEPVKVDPPDVPIVHDGRARPVADLSDGCHPSFCSSSVRCAEGGGDCDSDSECLPGLFCRRGVGASHGCPASFDMCAKASYWCGSACSPEEPCQAGRGDCAGDSANCRAGLQCIVDRGPTWGCAATVDICEAI